MAITSFGFLSFFAAVFVFYYLCPKKFQWMLLLVASAGYFLTAGDPWLLVYPLFTLTIVYAGALYIDRVKEQKQRRVALSLVVVFCLLTLAVLRYCNFGVYTYNAIVDCFFSSMGRLTELSFLAPIGISFYTLALLGYLFDVYYEIGKPQKNFFKLALFGLYFPTIVSGPIVRYRDMEEQLYAGHKFDYKQVTFGLQRMIWGFFKKLVIAERLGILVGTVYGDYTAYPGTYIFVATIGFALQLYADFSGGMDIVLGLSETFGIKLAENFQTPFFSKSIQEFWRRWHITLGTWLKDYLFFPLLRTEKFARMQEWFKKKLGKKKGKKISTYTGMFVLWFAVGMWHGGSWKFIIGSGLLHWVYIVGGEMLEPLWKKMRALCRATDTTKWFQFFRQLRTFLLVCAGFVFFRANSFREGCAIYKSLFSAWNPQVLINGGILSLGLDWIELSITVVSLLMLLAVSIMQQRKPVREWLAERNIVLRWVILYGILFYVILLGYYGPEYSAAEFIYQGF